MKKMIKYQLKDLLLSYSVYAAAMVLLLAVLVSVSAMYDDINMSINGNGFSSVIFCFRNRHIQRTLPACNTEQYFQKGFFQEQHILSYSPKLPVRAAGPAPSGSRPGHGICLYRDHQF